MAEASLTLPVNGSAGGRKDHPANLGCRGCLEKVKAAHHVDLSIPNRIRYRSPDVHLGSEMEDDIGPFPAQNPDKPSAIANVCPDCADALGDIFPSSTRVVVEDGYAVTLSQESFDEVRSDEPRTSRDQCLHRAARSNFSLTEVNTRSGRMESKLPST